MGSAEFEPVENALSGISISMLLYVVTCIAWYAEGVSDYGSSELLGYKSSIVLV
jgi:hypothetical protein